VFNGDVLTIVQLEGDNIDSQVKFYSFSDADSLIELESFVYSIPTDD